MARRFPTFAVLILILGLLWLAVDLKWITIPIPWLPLIVILIAIGWIVKFYTRS